MAAGEQVVPASELAAAMKQIKELLKEAVEYGRAKTWIAHAPLLPGDGGKLSQPLSPGVACAVARHSQTNR